MTASSITSVRTWRQPSARAASGFRGGRRRGVPAGLERPEPIAEAGVASLDFFWDKRRVGAYYFYILDEEFGPAFIKICPYGPWSAKVWVNGHEWAKLQAAKAGIVFGALSTACVL